jgi:hypothetical protein
MGFRTRLLKACIRLAFRLMADRSPDARAFPEKNRTLILRWDAIPGAIQTAISQSLPALTGCNGSQALIHLGDSSLKHQSWWNFTISASHVTDTAPQSPESM